VLRQPSAIASAAGGAHGSRAVVAHLRSIDTTSSRYRKGNNNRLRICNDSRGLGARYPLLPGRKATQAAFSLVRGLDRRDALRRSTTLFSCPLPAPHSFASVKLVNADAHCRDLSF
jgi:hypothetical protein